MSLRLPLSRLVLGLFAVAILIAPRPAAAVALLVNGGFEAALVGWTVTDQAGGSGSWFSTGAATTPLSGFATVGPAGGVLYAVSDQGGPGTHALEQSFTIPGAGTTILTFDMFVNDQNGAGAIVHPSGLDYTSGGTNEPNQHARVDIMTAGATAFDTGAGVLLNLYLGVDAGPNPHAYTAYAFDLSALGPGTFKIRFAEVDNQFFFHQGVDNVSIDFTAVPEPGVLSLLGVGIAVAAIYRRRRSA